MERLAGTWWHRKRLAGAPKPSRRRVEVRANFYGALLGGSRIISFGSACRWFHPPEMTHVAAHG